MSRFSNNELKEYNEAARVIFRIFFLAPAAKMVNIGVRLQEVRYGVEGWTGRFRAAHGGVRPVW